jgi:hypothetical protein
MGSDYLLARFADETPDFQQHMADSLARGTEEAERPLLSAVEVTGRALAAEVERGAARLSANTASAVGEVTTPNDPRASVEMRARSLVGALAQWEDGKTIPMTERGQPAPTAAITAALPDAAHSWAADAKRDYPALSEPVPNTGPDIFAQLGMQIVRE